MKAPYCSAKIYANDSILEIGQTFCLSVSVHQMLLLANISLILNDSVHGHYIWVRVANVPSTAEGVFFFSVLF